LITRSISGIHASTKLQASRPLLGYGSKT